MLIVAIICVGIVISLAVMDLCSDNPKEFPVETKQANRAETLVIRQGVGIHDIAQMVCDTENQPHQYIGDIGGFTKLLNENIKNLLDEFNDEMIDILPEGFDGKKVNAVYDRILNALSV
jgi:hypothetical protein